MYAGQAVFKVRDQANLDILPRKTGVLSACAGSYGVGAGETKISVTLPDASVREILDAILPASRSMMWLVVFSSQQPEKGYLKTKSPLRNTTDFEQPDIDLVSRYHDPTTGRYRSDWKIGIMRP